MRENKLIVFLLIFSIALNIGIIGYLFYERTTHEIKDFSVKQLPPETPEITERKEKRFYEERRDHSFFRRNRMKLTREERENLRKFFQNTFQTLKPLIEKQMSLKKELINSIKEGDISKTKQLVEEIHKNQAKIDILFLEKASNEIKRYPKNKQRIISYVIMRLVSINKRRRF